MWIALLSLLVAFGRFLIPGHELSPAGTYEALAHIWVGVLLVLAIQKGQVHQKAAIFSLVLITALETVMFAAFKAAQQG